MNKNTQTIAIAQQKLDEQLLQDFKNAVLVVSVLVNMTIFIGWLTITMA